MKNIEIKQHLETFARQINRFRFVIFLGLFAGIYIYMSFQINTLLSKEPSQKAITEQSQTVKKLNIDDEGVAQMLKLTEENIEAKAIYERARNNPFAE